MQLRSKNPGASHSIWLKTLALINLTILSFLFSSCSDDTVSPPKPPPTVEIKDSSIFDWQFVDCSGNYMSDMYVLDTNRIFFAAWPNLCYYNGAKIVSIETDPPYYFPQIVRGFDENNVFFGGFYYNSGSDPVKKLWLKKWNGSSIETTLLPNDTTLLGFRDMFVNNLNDIWISVYPAKFYHFDGTNFTTYISQNQNMYLSYFFKDLNSDLFTSAATQLQVNHWLFQVFKLENNNWSNYISDTVIQNVSPLQFGSYPCGTDYIRMGLNSLYCFNGQGWTFLSSTPGFNAHYIGGVSKDSFLCSGKVETLPYYRFFYYNGLNWYRQSNFMPPYVNYYDEINSIKEKNNNYYGFFNNSTYENYFFIGKPKISGAMK
jgi:hypothetical protein